MKKFIYLLLIPLCMGFVACGGDDEEEQQQQQQQQQETKNPLVGTWERVEKIDFSSGNKWTYTYTFKNDGKYEYIRNETFTSKEPGEDSNTSYYTKGNYAYDSTTRTLSIVSDEGESQSFTVLTLTDNILTIMEYDGDQWTFSKKN